MPNESDEQKLIEEFLSALHLRRLDQCQRYLQLLEGLALQHPHLHTWYSYLNGIMAFEAEGNWSKAEQIFATLLQIELEPELRGRVLYALGRAFDIQGRWNDAIATFEQIIASGQTIEKAKAWKHIAITYRNGFAQGDFDTAALQRAIAYCQLALHALGSVSSASSDIHWLIGSVWNTLGLIHMNLGDWDQAVTCYQHDLTICQLLDDQHGIGISYLNLGEIYQKRGQANWPAALDSYQQALQIFREFDDPYLEADILANLAFLHQEMGQTEIAINNYGQAITIIEELRAGVSTEAARAGFFANVADIYANAALLCFDAGDIARAFAIIESARGRAFLDTLAACAFDLPKHVETTTLTLAEVQAALPADALLLEYFTTGIVEAREGRLAPGVQRHRFPASRTLVFAVTHTNVQAYDLGIAPSILRPSQLDSAVERHFLDPGTRRVLYDRLLALVAEALSGKHQLYIVPHGPLHYIPFQALIAPDGGTLLRGESPQLIYGPSATVLFRHRRAEPSRAPKPCLALGYNGEEPYRLRFAEEEARGVARLMGGDTLARATPKKDAIFAHAASYRLIHFSCHGNFNPEQPLSSALHLAPDEDLTAAEVIERLRLRCDLITLSACESGLNRVRRGDELIGMVRAFMVAGAPALLCSLWRVDESSTRLLMERFYQEIQAGAGFAVALMRAQLYLMSLTRQAASNALVHLMANDLFGKAIPSVETTAAQSPARPLEYDRNYLKGQPATKAAEASQHPDDLIYADPFFWAPFILIGNHGS
jgi:CHAT domain-containing protein/tetratricopeptide (TPR) repeat protein